MKAGRLWKPVDEVALVIYIIGVGIAIIWLDGRLDALEAAQEHESVVVEELKR